MRSVAGWLMARDLGPPAIRYRLLSELHIFEPVVGQPVDEESIDVGPPAGGCPEVSDRGDWSGIRVDLLDLGVERRPFGRVLLEIGLGDLVVEVGVVVPSPVRERARPTAHGV